MSLRAENVWNIATDGFSIEAAVFAAPEMESVLHHLIGSGIRHGRAGIRHLMSDTIVRKFANDRRLLELAKCGVGQPVFPFRATLFDKSAGANWLVVWHQDTALPLRERNDDPQWGPWSVKDGVIYAHAPAWALESVIALRVHLDDSDLENGPLRVLPGTHHSGVLNDYEIEELAEHKPMVECTVPKGGVVTMRPLTVHSSSKAISMKPRRVLHIEYVARRLDHEIQLAIA